MYLEIITPDKKVFEGECSSVNVPGAGGRFQVLDNHAPIISTLGNGDVTVKVNKDELVFKVEGGVIEVQKNKVILLAEKVITPKA